MARALIVGCGCRGRMIATELVGRDWLVRGTSRHQAGTGIESAGAEVAQADPAQPGTVLDLVGDVSVIVWLLGSARGPREQVRRLHGGAMERLLERLVDTPVRGFAYEAAGTVDDEILAKGQAVAELAAATWRIPLTLLERPAPVGSAAQSGVDWRAWAAEAAERIIAVPRSG